MVSRSFVLECKSVDAVAEMMLVAMLWNKGPLIKNSFHIRKVSGATNYFIRLMCKVTDPKLLKWNPSTSLAKQ